MSVRSGARETEGPSNGEGYFSFFEVRGDHGNAGVDVDKGLYGLVGGDHLFDGAGGTVTGYVNVCSLYVKGETYAWRLC
jgi:hypothetical protein